MTPLPAAALEVVTVALAAVAGWLLVPDDRARAGAPGATTRRAHLLWLLAAGMGAAGAALRDVLDLIMVVDLLVAVTVVAATLRLVHRARVRAAAARRRTQVVHACDALAAELHSGRPPQAALEQVALEWTELAPAAAEARLGGDAARALRALADRPGGQSLREVAAAWQVSARSGASLAQVLDRVGVALRDQEDVANETAAAVAPARATAHLLAVLPVVGLGLGAVLGGDPLRVLFASSVGSLLLVLGSALAMAGVFWVERLVTSVEV